MLLGRLRLGRRHGLQLVQELWILRLGSAARRVERDAELGREFIEGGVLSEQVARHGTDRPVDLNLPIACGGVAVYPGDIVVGDRDAVLVIPPEIVEAVAEEALNTYHYEEFAEAEVARGRSLKGLFPVAGEEAKRDFEAWKKSKG